MSIIDSDHPAILSRRTLIAGSAAAAAAGLIQAGSTGTPAFAAAKQLAKLPNRDIAVEIYRGFASNDFKRWDAVIHPNVQANSPVGRGIRGLPALKRFNEAFVTAFRPRTDLIDEFVDGDRGLLTMNLHWKHDGGSFNGIAPTGQSGTSVETFLLRIKAGFVTHLDVANNSLDLAQYLYDQGMKLPTFVEVPALIKR